MEPRARDMGLMVLRQVGRWKHRCGFLRWWPSIRAWSLALSMHWLLVALEEGGNGCLLGLYQLLQALQHRETQGLKGDSQVDSLTFYGMGCGGRKQRSHRCLGWETEFSIG